MMGSQKKHNTKKPVQEKDNVDSIKELKDKMKHQKDALKKILKKVQNNEKDSKK
jgi:hypothetical protein